MAKILLTGASGFIGKHLLKALLIEKHEVIAVVRDKVKLHEFCENFDNLKVIECELGNFYELNEFLSDESISTTIHLAWDGSSGVKRADYDLQLKNIKATLELIEISAKLGCKHFISTGTVSENLVELKNANIKSQNMIYAAAKLSLYNLAKVLCSTCDIKFTGVD